MTLSLPFVFFEVGASLTFMITALDTSLTTYYWSFGDGAYDDTIGYKITHTFDPELEISIQLTVVNSCGSNFHYEQLIVQNIKERERDFLISNTKIYSNPTQGQLHLSISDLPAKQDIFIKLRNSNGMLVYDEKLVNSTSSYSWQFNTHHLPKGLYLLQLKLNGAVLSKRILIL